MYAETWCELMVARLLYTNPLAKFFDLDEDIRWATDAMQVDTNGDELSFNTLLYLAMQQSTPLKLLSLCCKFFSFNWWFPSHLADMLAACGSSSSVLSYRPNDRPDRRLAIERERMLIGFAQTLASEPGLFISLAPAYFAQ